MGRPGRKGRARSPATVAGGLVTGLLLLLAATAAAAPAPAAAAGSSAPSAPSVAAGSSAPSAPSVASVAVATTPLRVELDDIVPGSLPRRGSITVTGSLTNADDHTWTTINLYTFLGDDPIDDPAELAAAALTGEDLAVGDRITESGTEAVVETLEPGESASFTLEVPATVLLERVARRTGTAEPGVYWFGVHALGTGPEGRDGLTDARARTFVPLLPRTVREAVPTSLVLPLRAPVAHEADGSVADVEAWTDRLSFGGRLRDLVDVGAASGEEPVSWLVDPAVLDAVDRLARGNPARLAAAGTSGVSGVSGGSSAAGSPSPSSDPAEGSASPGATSGGEGRIRAAAPSAAEIVAAGRAQVWLERLASVLEGDELLTLPFGDVDVAGALEHGVATYEAARRRQGAVLRSVATQAGSTLVPTVAPPDGHLDPATPGALDALDDGSLLLGSDEMVDGPTPSVVLVQGRPVVLAAAGAAAGGPGPTPALSTLALRQRVLSEATLRLVADRGEGPDSLVVVLPEGWVPEGGSAFFAGLDSPALRLSPLGGVGSGSAAVARAAPGDLLYPGFDRRAELGRALFSSVSALRAAGGSLESLLSRNSTVGDDVAAEALAAASYEARSSRASARASLAASRAWIRERLAAVRVQAPSGVTLSGSTGSFATTLVNNLDEPVVVRVRAITDEGISVPSSGRVEIAAGARSTVQMQADDVTPGVHNVALRLVDVRGRVLPGGGVVPIRSAQVSNVIWLLLGGGAGLLLLTVGARTVRRYRAREAGA